MGDSGNNTIDFMARLRAVLAARPGAAPPAPVATGPVATGPVAPGPVAPGHVAVGPVGGPKGAAGPAVLSTHHPVQGRPILDELEAYWRDLRGTQRLPVRAQIEAERLDAALPHAFILEEVAPGVGRLRVSGQRLNALLGTEARGMPLTTFFSHGARAVIAEQLRHVFDRPAIVELPVLSPRAIGRPRLSGRLLLLPLGGEPHERRMALGALLVDGMIGSAPRRFDIPEGAAIRREAQPHAPRKRLHATAGGRRVAQEPAPTEDRPHLRLVVSNNPAPA